MADFLAVGNLVKPIQVFGEMNDNGSPEAPLSIL